MNHAIPLIPGKYGTAGKRILTFGLQVPYFKHIPIFFLSHLKTAGTEQMLEIRFFTVKLYKSGIHGTGLE